MATKSLANGDYTFVMLVESASARTANTWYRVLADKRSGLLSCDCHTWVFKGDVETDAQGTEVRLCKHSRFARVLLSQQRAAGSTAIVPLAEVQGVATTHPLVAATQQQWRGLGGVWGIEERTAQIGGDGYELVLLSLRPGNGGLATGLVAFAQRHHDHRDYAGMVPGMALWGGFSIASQVARMYDDFSTVAPPTVHFKVPGRDGAGRVGPRRAQGPVREVPFAARVGLADILRVGDRVDLGDGLTPEVRAEHTLRLFLGETLYAQLERNGYLDVPSVRFAPSQRVYRLRRDPHKASERRVRVFEHGRHINDYCIVRAQAVPEADFYLSLFLGLLSDEQELLRAVTGSNIFRPDSEGLGPERVPAVWKPRADAAAA